MRVERVDQRRRSRRRWCVRRACEKSRRSTTCARHRSPRGSARSPPPAATPRRSSATPRLRPSRRRGSRGSCRSRSHQLVRAPAGARCRRARRSRTIGWNSTRRSVPIDADAVGLADRRARPRRGVGLAVGREQPAVGGVDGRRAGRCGRARSREQVLRRLLAVVERERGRAGRGARISACVVRSVDAASRGSVHGRRQISATRRDHQRRRAWSPAPRSVSLRRIERAERGSITGPRLRTCCATASRRDESRRPRALGGVERDLEAHAPVGGDDEVDHAPGVERALADSVTTSAACACSERASDASRRASARADEQHVHAGRRLAVAQRGARASGRSPARAAGGDLLAARRRTSSSPSTPITSGVVGARERLRRPVDDSRRTCRGTPP